MTKNAAHRLTALTTLAATAFPAAGTLGPVALALMANGAHKPQYLAALADAGMLDGIHVSAVPTDDGVVAIVGTGLSNQPGDTLNSENVEFGRRSSAQFKLGLALAMRDRVIPTRGECAARAHLLPRLPAFAAPRDPAEVRTVEDRIERALAPVRAQAVEAALEDAKFFVASDLLDQLTEAFRAAVEDDRQETEAYRTFAAGVRATLMN